MKRRGFTVIEMMIAGCVLVIVLGLAVSLSRHVRGRSARSLTNDVLARLEKMLDMYVARNGPGTAPWVTPIPLPVTVDAVEAEEVAFRSALRNNRDFLRAMRPYGMAELFKDLPSALYDPAAPDLRDAWGTPLVLWVPPAADPKRAGSRRLIESLGSSPRGGNAAFFVSAGPDRQFLTLVDNLYSYESFRQPE